MGDGAGEALTLAVGDGVAVGDADALGDALADSDTDGEGSIDDDALKEGLALADDAEDTECEGEADGVAVGIGSDAAVAEGDGVESEAFTNPRPERVLIDISGDALGELDSGPDDATGEPEDVDGEGDTDTVGEGEASGETDESGDSDGFALTDGDGLASLDTVGEEDSDGAITKGSQIGRARGSPGISDDIEPRPGVAAARNAPRDATTRAPAPKARAHREELNGRI